MIKFLGCISAGTPRIAFVVIHLQFPGRFSATKEDEPFPCLNERTFVPGGIRFIFDLIDPPVSATGSCRGKGNIQGATR